MSEPSAVDQSGGVLAVPPRPRRIMIAAATLAAALAATAIVVLVAVLHHPNPHPARPPSNLIATLRDPGGRGATSAAFSPDGTTLAILDGDGATHLWDVATRRWAGSLASPQCSGGYGQVLFSPDSDGQVLFSPDGKTLAVVDAFSDDICLWDVAARKQIAVLTQLSTKASGASVTAGAFSPDGSTLAIADSSGRISLWDVATAQQVATLTDPDAAGSVTGVAFGPGGTTLAAGDYNYDGDYNSGTTYIWNVPERRLTGTLTDPADHNYPDQEGAADSVAFSQDGTVAVGDGNAEVFLWDAASGKQIAALAPRINVLESNPLFSNGQSDVSGLLEGSQDPIGVTVAFSQDGNVLATGIDDGYGVEVWTGTGAPTHRIASLTDPGGDNSQAPQLALNPAGTMLAVVDSNGRTYVWRLP